MSCAVADTAWPLLGVGGPLLPLPTVTSVALAGDVMRSEAVSVAVIVAVAPIAALAATVAMPFALTVTAAVFED